MAVRKSTAPAKSTAAAKKTGSSSGKPVTAKTGVISDLDCYLFGEGTHYDIYQKLGAHPMTYKGTAGI